MSGKVHKAPSQPWLQELKAEDLRRLRSVVHKIHFKYHPEHMQTDSEADRIIESLGPAAAESVLRKLIDSRLVG